MARAATSSSCSNVVKLHQAELVKQSARLKCQRSGAAAISRIAAATAVCRAVHVPPRLQAPAVRGAHPW